MKLKFERFEGLSSFSVRGSILPAEFKILQVGLEKIAEEADSLLIVNLALAIFPDALNPVLQSIKKSLKPANNVKIQWISSVKHVGDYPNLAAYTSRLTGFKHRQIGELLVLDDLVHELTEKEARLKARASELTGDENKAAELIVRNHALKEQERILKETVRFQKERIKLQTKMPVEEEDVAKRQDLAMEELVKFYGTGVDL